MLDLFLAADSGELRDYIEDNTYDPWKGTSFEGYVFLGSKKQGAYGERFIARLLSVWYGLDVQPPENPGHDRIVGGIKTEFKFTIAHRDCAKQRVNADSFAINHVAFAKDWERLVICAINPIENDSHLVYITKDDFAAEMASDDPVFKRQQGGSKSMNDDFCVAGKIGCTKLFQRPYIKGIDLW